MQGLVAGARQVLQATDAGRREPCPPQVLHQAFQLLLRTQPLVQAPPVECAALLVAAARAAASLGVGAAEAVAALVGSLLGGMGGSSAAGEGGAVGAGAATQQQQKAQVESSSSVVDLVLDLLADANAARAVTGADVAVRARCCSALLDAAAQLFACRCEGFGGGGGGALDVRAHTRTWPNVA